MEKELDQGSMFRKRKQAVKSLWLLVVTSHASRVRSGETTA
jgi:hypothetical protein